MATGWDAHFWHQRTERPLHVRRAIKLPAMAEQWQSKLRTPAIGFMKNRHRQKFAIKRCQLDRRASFGQLSKLRGRQLHQVAFRRGRPNAEAKAPPGDRPGERRPVTLQSDHAAENIPIYPILNRESATCLKRGSDDPALDPPVLAVDHLLREGVAMVVGVVADAVEISADPLHRLRLKIVHEHKNLGFRLADLE